MMIIGALYGRKITLLSLRGGVEGVDRLHSILVVGLD